MNLDAEPPRPMTDREVASVLGAVLSGLMIVTPPSTVKRGLAFLLEHFDTLAESVTMMQRGMAPPEIAKRIIERIARTEDSET